MTDWEDMRELAKLAKPTSEGHQRLRFKEAEYLLIGDRINGGAIATQEQYEAGECSFAHLFPDGSIMRFYEKIGTAEDIEWLP